MNSEINSTERNQRGVKVMLLALVIFCVVLALWFYTNESLAEPTPSYSHPLVNGQTVPEMSDGGCLGCHLSTP